MNDPTSTHICFFRHSPVKRQGVCYGQSQQDTIHTAEAVAEIFMQKYRIRGQKDDASGVTQSLRSRVCLWSSPAPRCRLPAILIAQRLDLNMKVDSRLFEMHFGVWEGRTWEEIERTAPEAFQHWMDHWKTEAPPHGESLRQFQDRVKAWFIELDPRLTHILMGHAGVLRALQVVYLQKTWDEAMSMSIPHLELISIP